MGETRVDVKTGNEEDEKSLEEGIPTLEVIQKNLTSREELELEDCGHADYRSSCVACVEDRCAEKHFKLNRWRKKEENGQSHHGYLFDCVFSTQENADTTLEYENEPRPEVFQEAKNYSCVEAVARIAEDIPLLDGILHFAMRFLNKIGKGRGWKESLVQFGKEELTSFGKRIIQGVFVCHSMIEQEQSILWLRNEYGILRKSPMVDVC